jgi:hypothetical protein
MRYALVIVLLVVVSTPALATIVTCRTYYWTGSIVTRCTDGSVIRVDRWGTIRDNHGTVSRTFHGTTRCNVQNGPTR